MAELRQIVNPANEVAMSLLDLQKADVMCDITLVAEDSSITKAHKLVLFAVSPYFQNLYQSENSFDTFLLKGASPYTVTSLIQYLYGNAHAIDSQNARDVYPFAVQLGLMHAVTLCNFLVPDLEDSTFDFEDLCILPIVHKSTATNKKFCGPLSVKKKRMEKALKKEGLSPRKEKGKPKVLGTVTIDHQSSHEEDGQEVKVSTPPKKKKKVKKKTPKELHLDDNLNHENSTSRISEAGHVPTQEKVYECTFCEEIRDTWESMQNHMRQDRCWTPPENVSDDDSLTFTVPCANFGGMFAPSKTTKQMAKHQQEFSLWNETVMDRKHTGIIRSICEDSVSLEKLVDSENLPVPRKRKASFECMLCQRPHATLESVQEHMELEHKSHIAGQEDSNSDGSLGSHAYPNLSVKFSPTDVARDVAEQQEDFSLWKEGQISEPQSGSGRQSVDSTPKTPRVRRSSIDNRGIVVEDEGLPEGWKKVLVERLGGKFAGRRDIHFVSPTGRKFKYRKQMEEYFAEKNEPIDISKFNFSRIPYKAHVARSIEKEVSTPGKKKSKASHTGSPKNFFKGTPRIKLSGSFTGKSKSTDKDISAGSTTKKTSPGKRGGGTKRKHSGSPKPDEHSKSDDEDSPKDQGWGAFATLNSPADDETGNTPAAENSIAKELMMSIIGHIEFQEGNGAKSKTPAQNDIEPVQNTITPHDRHQEEEPESIEDNGLETPVEKRSHETNCTSNDDIPVSIKQEIVDDDL